MKRRSLTRVIDVEDAVDTVLRHNITRTAPGQCEEPGFRRGHMVRRKGIPGLRARQEHLYVFDLADGCV